MTRNKNSDIYESIKKANFHYDRASGRKVKTKAQQRYSAAFVRGDNASNGFPEGIRNSSRRFTTQYEKKAFWRGVKNGQKRGRG